MYVVLCERELIDNADTPAVALFDSYHEAEQYVEKMRQRMGTMIRCPAKHTILGTFRPVDDLEV